MELQRELHANQFFRNYLLRGDIGSKQSWPGTGRALYDYAYPRLLARLTRCPVRVTGDPIERSPNAATLNQSVGDYLSAPSVTKIIILRDQAEVIGEFQAILIDQMLFSPFLLKLSQR